MQPFAASCAAPALFPALRTSRACTAHTADRMAVTGRLGNRSRAAPDALAAHGRAHSGRARASPPFDTSKFLPQQTGLCLHFVKPRGVQATYCARARLRTAQPRSHFISYSLSYIILRPGPA